MTAASLVSLMTAAMVLAAFRLPAFMMFRGFRSPLGIRRPVMVLRAPMPRSMPVADPRTSNTSFITLPPQPYPLPRPQFWPFPGPLVPPIPYIPSKGEPLPQLIQSDQISPPQPSETFGKPFFVPTPRPNVNRDLKTSKSVNNRPFFKPNRKHEYVSTTTTQEIPLEHHFHQIFRPSNQANKLKKTAEKHSEKKITTQSYNNLKVNHNFGNEEMRYAMMYPMPRNYQNHRMDGLTPQTTSTETSQTLFTTLSTITTTSQTKAKSFTKVWVKPSLKAIVNKNSESTDSPLNWDNLKKTNTTSTSSTTPTPKTTKKKFRSNKTKATTTTEGSTAMTPAPIENYKPVKARVHPNHRYHPLDISEKLMFDDTKNLYYYITMKTT